LKKVFIIAGDNSGDLHAAKVMRALRLLYQDIEFYGIGGENMIAQGLESLADLREISVVGFWEVLKKYSFFTNLITKVKNQIKEIRPDIFVPVDYPGFNQRIAGFAKSLGIPVVWYIAPQLWAWGENRSKKLANVIDELIVAFPFDQNTILRASIARYI